MNESQLIIQDYLEGATLNALIKKYHHMHETIRKILIENNLWERLLNDDRFIEYLREE